VFGLLSGLSAKLIAAAVCLAFAFTGGISRSVLFW
jgi:hypothetical protein